MRRKMRDHSVKTEMQPSLGLRLDDRATLTPCCSVHSPCLVSEANTENRKAKKTQVNQYMQS